MPVETVRTRSLDLSVIRLTAGMILIFNNLLKSG